MSSNPPEFYEQAFKGTNPPDGLRRAAERICNAYGIQGLADPMYIVNVIAAELSQGTIADIYCQENPDMYPDEPPRGGKPR